MPPTSFSLLKSAKLVQKLSSHIQLRTLIASQSRKTCLRLSTASFNQYKERMLWTSTVIKSQPQNSSDYLDHDDSPVSSTYPTPDLQRIKLAASRKETPLSISQCIKLGESLSSMALHKNLAFLNRELPARFSRRIMELRGLPTELKETDPFQNLLKNYSVSFNEIQTFSDSHLDLQHSDDDEDKLQENIQKEYASLLQDITNRHKQDVIFMAHGISLFKRYQGNRNRPSDEIQHFLNSFNRGRLGIRIMVGHHLALHHQFFHHDEPSSSAYLSTPSSAHTRRVGIIEPQCDIESMIQRASHSAQFVFFHHYNTVFPPNIHIEHSKELGGKKVRFPVVPALLHHILFELLKNSMRATAEFHGLDKSSYP
ncbi:hypothetical protein BGZ76_000584, partial [Entomortierella beljakovae]